MSNVHEKPIKGCDASNKVPFTDRGTTVLLLGDYRPTLTLARTLGRSGLVVEVGGRLKDGAVHRSRWCRAIHDLPDTDRNADDFVSALLELLCQRQDIVAVIPVAENFARVLAEHGSALPRDILWAMPAPETVMACLDKPSLFQRASKLGIPVAPFMLAEDSQNLATAPMQIGFPMVVRPLASTNRISGEKAIIVASDEAFQTKLGEWPDGQRGLLIQRKVNGPRHNLYFAAHKGNLIRLCEARITRTDRPDGTGLAVDGETVVPDPARTAYLQAIAADLSYTGIGCAQFLVDPNTGESWFLEINPRVAGNHAVPEAAGLGLGPLSLSLARGEVAQGPLFIGKPGLRYAWSYGDLSRVKRLWQKPNRASIRTIVSAVIESLNTALRADIHMTWCWSDPMPTLTLYGRLLTRGRNLVATEGDT